MWPRKHGRVPNPAAAWSRHRPRVRNEHRHVTTQLSGTLKPEFPTSFMRHEIVSFFRLFFNQLKMLKPFLAWGLYKTRGQAWRGARLQCADPCVRCVLGWRSCRQGREGDVCPVHRSRTLRHVATDAAHRTGSICPQQAPGHSKGFEEEGGGGRRGERRVKEPTGLAARLGR